ncbi:MAG TPA: hypothetical protein VGE92_16300 [Steroidobacteraceae bacterium]|jgi:hypothetical protein
MYRRKVTLAAAALFAIGIAFAAQPTSEHADSGKAPLPGTLWVPGTNMLMPAADAGMSTLALPR